MRILLFASDLQAARTIHEKLLTYQGSYWDLRHYTSTSKLKIGVEETIHDVVLVSLQDHETIDGTLDEILENQRTSPIVLLAGPELSLDAEKWIERGISDVISDEESTTNLLMRRLRLALARFDRHRTEYREAVDKLVLQRSVAGSASGLEPSLDTIESTWISRTRTKNDSLSVAILKERNTPSLLEGLAERGTVEIFHDLWEYRNAVEQDPNRFDAAIVEQDFVEREGVQEFDRELLSFPAPPTLLIATDRSDVPAVANVLHGFDDCISTQSASTETVFQSIRLSISRWECGRSTVNELLRRAPNISERRQLRREEKDRRSERRYLITRSILAIPVFADGTPDRANVQDAFSVDFSSEGIGFQLSNQAGIPGRNWVVGVEFDPKDGGGSRFFFNHVKVESVGYPQGGIRLGTRFHPQETNLLSLESLQPRLIGCNGRFEPALSQQALEQWVELGVLRPKLMHRIQCCPECEGTASIGRGCNECGSPDIRFSELAHHFACGHIDDITFFKSEEGMGCPNCLVKPIEQGVEYELVHSDYVCNACEYEGVQVAHVGTCLNCRLRFPSEMAIEREVYGYEVDRLDVSKLINEVG